MSGDVETLDQQIEKLRKGDTLTETEVRLLCEKVRTDKGESWEALDLHIHRDAQVSNQNLRVLQSSSVS
jgi:hypothetical protein